MVKVFDVKDSGSREQYQTGAQRDVRAGKGRFDLISPRFLNRLALVLERGAAKYGDRNWEKGMPLSRFLDSAMRHINQLRLGRMDEDHAAQAAWNLHAFIHIAELVEEGNLPSSLDDLGYTGDDDGAAPCAFGGKQQLDASGMLHGHADSVDRGEKARLFLRGYLSLGPLPVADVFRAMQEEGFDTLEAWRARNDLMLQVVYQRGGPNLYRLPGEEK